MALPSLPEHEPRDPNGVPLHVWLASQPGLPARLGGGPYLRQSVQAPAILPAPVLVVLPPWSVPTVSVFYLEVCF